MTRKGQLIALCLSLVLVSFSIYRMNQGLSRLGAERYLHSIIFGLAGFLFFYLLYKGVIKRFSKGHIDQKKYAKLFELETTVVSGELEFYFTIEESRKVKFTILNRTLEVLQVLKDEVVNSGGHIVRFDSSTLENGIYFYCLETENQKTMKRLSVQHDKLTV